MAEISENTVFLYECIKSRGFKKIDFKTVGEALDLKTGTASMRWRRLKDRIEKTPLTAAATAKNDVDKDTVFLYNCIMACDFTFDWSAVGKNLGLKSGTASMRWRRLKDKVQVSDLPEVGVLAVASTPISSRPVAQTGAIAAPAAASVAPKIPPKRKRNVGSDDDSSEISIDERLAKKIKQEDHGVTKRQTRGKVLDLRDPVDSSSSVTGTSIITTESSFYEPSAIRAEEEDDYMSDIGADKPDKPKTKTLPQTFKIGKNVQSRAIEQKATSKQQLWDPSSVCKPLTDAIGKPETPSESIEAKLGFSPWIDGMSRTPTSPKADLTTFNEDSSFSQRRPRASQG